MDSTNSEQQQPETKLVNVELTNENVALNVMVSFLNLAHKRGAFSLDESAKIWECINKFNPASKSNNQIMGTGYTGGVYMSLYPHMHAPSNPGMRLPIMPFGHRHMDGNGCDTQNDFVYPWDMQS